MKSFSPLERLVLAVATAAALSFSVELARATGEELPSCQVIGLFRQEKLEGLWSESDPASAVADLRACALRAVRLNRRFEKLHRKLVSLYFTFEEEGYSAEGKLTDDRSLCQLQASLKLRGSSHRAQEWHPLSEVLPDFKSVPSSFAKCYDSAKLAFQGDSDNWEIERIRFSYPLGGRNVEVTVSELR